MSKKTNFIFITIAILLFTTATVGLLTYTKIKQSSTITLKKYKTNAVYSNNDLVDGNIYSFNLYDYLEKETEPLCFKYIRTNKIELTRDKSDFIALDIIGSSCYLRRVDKAYDSYEINSVIEKFDLYDFFTLGEDDYYLNMFGGKTVDAVYCSEEDYLFDELSPDVYKYFTYTEYVGYEVI